MESRHPIESIKSTIAAARAAAPKIYADLLDPTREPQPDDEAKLRDVMVTLGLSMSQVEQHAEVRRQAQRMEELKLEIEEIIAKRQKVAIELNEVQEKFRAAEKEFVERRGQILNEFNILDRDADVKQNQLDRIQDMRLAHPLAFGIVKQEND